MLQNQRGDALYFNEDSMFLKAIGVRIGRHECFDGPTVFYFINGIMGKQAMGGDGVNFFRPRIAIGFGGVDQRSARPDHVIINQHHPVFDLRTD